MTEEEIEIDYRPIRKVVILDLVQLQMEQLLERVAAIRMAEQPVFLNWAEGVVFIAVPASSDISEVNENITKGIVYFAGIMFSFMPKYQSYLQFGTDKIPVIDQSNYTVYKCIARWIRNRMNMS
ncbi:MAG: hypothetical protein QXF26_05650 [Candidatus Bathyarchaeia archaeon]